MIKKKFVCQECGYNSSKWLGKCPECSAWDSFEEEVDFDKSKKLKNIEINESREAKSFDKIEASSEDRIASGLAEFDRVLGGGLVKGSVVLISGKPGIGKSTLLLQVLEKYSKKGKVLYISGEESPEQVKGRGNRIGIEGKNFFILPETRINAISAYIRKEKPSVVVVDSIQTLLNEEVGTIPGTMSQIRETAIELVSIAKEMAISFLIVGHITKEGKIAGPKLLEHMVDCVLEFEGDEDFAHRILRVSKNRYGATNEIGIFVMSEEGMEEVVNPSEYFLEERALLPGSVVVPVLEGNRTFLLEVQSLVSNAIFGLPRRIAQGLDTNKVQIVAAIVEKNLNLNLLTKDVFFNIPGGIRSKDTSLGLGMVFSLISSFKSVPIPAEVAVMGEVGLIGEIRKVPFSLKRATELARVGFKKLYAPMGNKKELQKAPIDITYVQNISDLLKFFN